jgi:hypothetical protein
MADRPPSGAKAPEIKKEGMRKRAAERRPLLRLGDVHSGSHAHSKAFFKSSAALLLVARIARLQSHDVLVTSCLRLNFFSEPERLLHGGAGFAAEEILLFDLFVTAAAD